MANWVVESGTFDVLSGQAESAQTVDLVISNIVNGVYSGYNLSASNFNVGGAAQGPTNTWTGGNVDDPVAKVVFSDLGIAGDPVNTVQAKVYLDAYTAASSATTIYVDIDEKAGGNGPQAVRSRTAHLYSTYDYYSVGQTVTVTDLPGSVKGMGAADLTESVEDDGSSSGITKNVHKGFVDGKSSTLIAQLVFATSSSSYYYAYQPTAKFKNLKKYEKDYFVDIKSTRSNGVISGFTVNVYYTPEESRGGSDEALDFLGHSVSINYELKEKQTAVTNTITNLNYGSSISFLGGESKITVAGISGTQYRLFLEKKKSLTSVDTADSGGYFNFSTGAFQDGIESLDATISSSNYNRHIINFPRVSANTRYDITIVPMGDPVATISSNINVAPAVNSITQYGINTLTIDAFATAATASKWGAMPADVTFSRPARYDGDNYSQPSHEALEVLGGTSGVASTRVLLNFQNPDIHAGMIVSASGVPHATTVVSNNNGVVILSAESTIANDTRIKFDTNSSRFIPFEFIIPENAGGDDITLVPGGLDTTPISGFTSVTVLTSTQTINSKTLTLDTTAGIAVGAEVSGTRIQNASDGSPPKVTAVAFNAGAPASSTVTLDIEQDLIDDNTTLVFNHSSLTFDSNVRHVQAAIVGTPTTGVIQGYILVDDIDTGTVRVELDRILDS